MEKVRGRMHEMASLRSGEWLTIGDIDEALFAIPGIVNYSVMLTRGPETDRLQIEAFSGSLEDRPRGIGESLLRIPAINGAVKSGYLTVDPIRLTSENWVTSGVVKRAILQRTEEEVCP